MNYDEKLDRILSILEGRQAPEPTFVVPTPELVDATVAALAPLGQYAPGRSLVSSWLETGASTAEIVDAVDRILGLWAAHAQHPSAPKPSPGADWREAAAYLERIKGHNGWSRVTHLLITGEMPGSVPSGDPKTSVFSNLQRAATVADMAAFVPEVLERAELGITWAGTQGTEGAELETRKEILAAGPADKRFLREWTEFRDPRLLRVLVLGNALGRTRGLGSYSLGGASPQMTLEEWLYFQFRASVPWPGSAYWRPEE